MIEKSTPNLIQETGAGGYQIFIAYLSANTSKNSSEAAMFSPLSPRLLYCDWIFTQ
jgi:hypothetical protein